MKVCILNILLLTTTITVLGQGTQPKPLPPTIQFLTLDPATGIPTINWTRPNFNPLHPDPTGYIIYKRIIDNLGNPINQAIATVEPSQFSYTDNASNGNASQIQYTVASNGPFEPSQLAAHHGSIYTTLTYDSCSNRIAVRWVHYLGWGNRIEKYNVYMGTNSDWTSMQLVATTPGSQTITLVGVAPNSVYYFYVEAKRMDSELISRSNLASITTNMARWPLYIKVDSIVARNRQNDVYFDIDLSTRLKKFTVTRWENSDSIASIFSAKTIYQFSNPIEENIADTNDSWAARSRPFYYKLNAFDGCNRLVRISRLSNSITIRVATQALRNNVIWDKLYSRENNRVVYSLFRITYTNEEQTPELIYSTENPIETSYLDDLTPFKGLGYSAQFCYYVEAKEYNSNNQVIMKSRSRRVCVEVVPDIAIPNAIDPLSNYTIGNGYRNLFEPVISFNSTYKLIVYNRIGEIVFTGNNEGWNGRMPNGNPAREGTYVYRLEVNLESRRQIVKTGNLNVIYLKK